MYPTSESPIIASTADNLDRAENNNFRPPGMRKGLRCTTGKRYFNALKHGGAALWPAVGRGFYDTIILKMIFNVQHGPKSTTYIVNCNFDRSEYRNIHF